jgi:iron complex outermembrane recepter protein
LSTATLRVEQAPIPTRAIMIFISCCGMVLNCYGQNVSSKIYPRNQLTHPRAGAISLVEILDRLEQIHSISFAYQKKFLSGKSAIYRPLVNENIETYLKEILEPNKLSFKKLENVEEDIYIIFPVLDDKPTANDPLSVDSVEISATPTESARTFFVYGSVRGAFENMGLPGVSVGLKGTTKGTTTDRYGNFSLEVPANSTDTLLFSYIGCETQQLPVTSRDRIEVVLTEKTLELSEVIVTALGLARNQKSLGYSVSTVDGNELTSSGNTNAASALYGKAPGIRIRTAPGGATSAVTVQVRGLNSLNYNTQPLYVIDGIIMRDGNERGAAGINNEDYFVDTRIRGNGILDINPNDIETLTILKGASASALYGSDAASGVVVITTKKGRKRQGLGVDINYQVTQENVAFTPRYQNVYGPGYDRSRNVAMGASEDGWVPVDVNGDGTVDGKRPLFESYAQFGPKMEGQEVFWWDGKTHRYSPHPDNYKDLYRRGYGSSFNIALSNQIDKWSYRLSYTRNDYAGIQVGGKLGRNTLNLNTSLRPSARLNMDLAVNYTNSSVYNRPLKINRLMSSWNGFFSRAEDMSLFFDKYKTSTGYKWVPFDQSQLNPSEALRFATPRGYEVMNLLWQQLVNSEKEAQNRIITGLTIDYELLKNVRLRGRIGNDFTDASTETRQHNEYPAHFNGAASTGSFGIANNHYSIFYTDALLSFSPHLKGKFGFSLNGGIQSRNEKYRTELVTTSGGLVLENWFNLTNSYNPTLNSTISDTEILKYAFLGVVNVHYKDYLFLEATGRQEYSSTLPPQHNRYFYPSVNAGFVFSEAFNLPKFLSYGKVRASFGVVGNAPPPYEANILYNLNKLLTPSGTVISATSNGSLFGNENIRPERKHEIELGLEARLFQNKLGIDIAYYRSRTKDQILKLDLPATTGSDRILTNVGTLAGQGWEVAVSATPVSKSVLWNANINMAFSSSILQRMAPGVDQLVFRDLEGGSIRIVAEKGQSIGNIYVYPRMRDAKGNLVINNSGMYTMDHSRFVKAGNLLPKVTGGFLNSVRYKNFDLMFNFDFSLGGQIVSPALKYGMGSGVYQSTLKYRDAVHGGLPYYINQAGVKVQLASHNAVAPGNITVYHDGIILDGVGEDGARNTTIVDAASYYLTTFDWGTNAWNEAGAVYDNSYIKLREVVLGYSMPKSITKKTHFQNIKLSLIGRNLFYAWRTLENLDPEATIGTNWLNQGIDEGSGAATRSYGFAVNLSF